MLDSLHRRPRGRPVAPLLSRLTGGRVPANGDRPVDAPAGEIVRALRVLAVPRHEDAVGAPSRALLERVRDEDVAETRRRLEPELLAIWDSASPVAREHLKLVFGVHAEVEPLLERTGLRTDMPPEDVHAMARGPLAAGGDFWLADLMAGGIARGGVELSAGARVLDFGCSSGRHLRVLQAWRPEVRWMGCDPNDAAVRWASAHLPGIEFFASPQEPPLELAGGSLDAVMAVSVWSHFGAGAALRWLEEMHRLLRPGGVLVLTTQGVASVAHYLRSGAVPEAYAVRALHDLIATGHHYVPAFGPDGDWGVQSEEWGMAYMTPDWLLSRALPRWAAVVYEPARIDTNQDLVVLRRA